VSKQRAALPSDNRAGRFCFEESIRMKNSKMNIRVMGSVAVLSAVSAVLSYINFTPPLSPAFVKLDISDVPALLAAFTFNPLAGVSVELINNLLGLFSSNTGGVGEFSNFIIGASMAFSAGLVYKRNRTLKGALISLIAASAAMAIVGSVMNYFVLLPLYSVFMPMDAIIAAFGVFIPFIHTKLDVVLYNAFPFNLIKGLLISVITFFLYKRLSPILKGTAK
jgi:riboflavin transporter FmnP